MGTCHNLRKLLTNSSVAIFDQIQCEVEPPTCLPRRELAEVGAKIKTFVFCFATFIHVTLASFVSLLFVFCCLGISNFMNVLLYVTVFFFCVCFSCFFCFVFMRSRISLTSLLYLLFVFSDSVLYSLLFCFYYFFVV